MALDAHALAAIMAKTSEVFARDDLMLSFPLAPEAFTTADLALLGAAQLDPEALGVLARFSLLVDSLPPGPVWLPDPGRRLSAVYDRVLRDADLAESDRTAEEEAAFTAAQALLYVPTGQGTLAPSPALQTYRQLRDAVQAAKAELRNREGQALLAGGEALAQWQQVDGPALRARISDLESDWESIGARSAIEAAQDTERRLADRSPLRTWDQLRRQFDPALDQLSSPTLGAYVPAWFTPTNVVADAAWPRITLGQGDLTALAGRGPIDAASLGAAAGARAEPAITQVAFEYNAVTVNRAWFSTVPFASHAWRFADGSLLSDGSQPPAGQCPAYVIAVVLVRNVSVTTPATNGGTPTPPIGRPKLPWLEATQIKVIPRPPIGLDRLPAGGAIPSHVPPLRVPVGAAGRLTAPNVGVAAPRVNLGPALVRPTAVAAATPLHPLAEGPSQELLDRLRGGDFVARRIDLGPGLVAAKPPAGTTTVTTPSDQVFVMALVCKRLPLTPSPDPSLTW